MKPKNHGDSRVVGEGNGVCDRPLGRGQVLKSAEPSGSIQPEGVPPQDAVTGGTDILNEKRHSAFRALARVLGFLSMMVPIAMTLMGLRYYAMMLNVVVFGTGTVLLDIPKRVYGVKSRLIRFFDFFWFTALYGSMLILNLVMQEPEQFGAFMVQLGDAIDNYEAGLITYGQLLLTGALAMGFLLIFFTGILSFFVLFFFLYGRKLRATEHSRGDVIIVYFALSSFVIFLGLGGTNLVNYVVAGVLLKDLLMHRRGFRYLIRKSSDSTKTVWDSLLRVAETPRLGCYTIHLFLWGITSAIFLAYLDLQRPEHIVYSVASSGLFVLSLLFIVDSTPMKLSMPAYLAVISVVLLMATRASCTSTLVGVFQSAFDSLYYFLVTLGSTTAVRYDALIYLGRTALYYELSIDTYMFRFLAHGLVSTLCAGFVIYGSMVLNQASKGKSLNVRRAIAGWGVVVAALLLEPVFWFVLTESLGMMNAEMLASSVGGFVMHIIGAAAALVFLALPFGLEARVLRKRGRPIGSIGTNRYLLVVVFALFMMILMDTIGVVQMTTELIVTNVLSLSVYSVPFVWVPLAFKIR